MLDDFIVNPGLSHLAIDIFAQVDLKTLAKSRLLSRNYRDFIDFECKFWKLLFSRRLDLCCRAWLPSPYEDLFLTLLKNGNYENHRHCANFLGNMIPNLTSYESPLDAAIALQDVCMVKTLVQFSMQSTDLKKMRLFGRQRPLTSPLHKAVKLESLEILDILLEHSTKSQVMCEDVKGQTPLHLAAKCGNYRAAKSIVDKSKCYAPRDDVDITPLHLAANEGYLDIVMLLCEGTENIACEDAAGLTPLHKAVFRGHVEVVKFLMGKLSDKDQLKTAFREGFTPLHLAAVRGNAELIQIICPLLTDANIQDGVSGRTPLHEAVIQGHLEAVKALLHFLEDKHPRNTMGMAPLHYAAKLGNLPILEAIVDAGGPQHVCVKDKNESTPLHYAAENGHLEVVQYLTVHMNDILCLDKKSRAPIDLAKRYNHDKVFNFLKSASTNHEIDN